MTRVCVCLPDYESDFDIDAADATSVDIPTAPVVEVSDELYQEYMEVMGWYDDVRRRMEDAVNLKSLIKGRGDPWSRMKQ